MTCYTPQGTIAVNSTTLGPSWDWVACSNLFSDDGFVLCCQTGAGYNCLTNLLCYHPGYAVSLRGACTDPTFKSKNCPQFCLDGDSNANGNEIEYCSDTTGCCLVDGPDNGCSCQPGAHGALEFSSNTVIPLVSTLAVASATSAQKPSSTTVTTSSSNTPSPTTTTTSSASTSSSTTTSSSSSAANTSSSTTITTPSDNTPSSSSSVSSTSSTAETNSSNQNNRSFSTSASNISQEPASATTTSIPASSAAASTISSGSSSPNLGLDVGLPVGLVGGLGLLAVIGVFLYRYRKRPISMGTYIDATGEKITGPGVVMN